MVPLDIWVCHPRKATADDFVGSPVPRIGVRLTDRLQCPQCPKFNDQQGFSCVDGAPSSPNRDVQNQILRDPIGGQIVKIGARLNLHTKIWDGEGWDHPLGVTCVAPVLARLNEVVVS